VDDVPPGDYHLTFSAYEPPPNPRRRLGEKIAFSTFPFTVPEMSRDRIDELLDLGNLKLNVLDESKFIPSLAGEPLPAFKGIQTEFTPERTRPQLILICFWDTNQRPSRRCLSRLVEQAAELKDKGVNILAIQASKVDQDALDEWVKKNNVLFPVGMIQDNEQKIRFDWGIKSLPWLILTNRQHIITAEGFSLSEIDGKIMEAENAK
jgi:hypothetical protein